MAQASVRCIAPRQPLLRRFSAVPGLATFRSNGQPVLNSSSTSRQPRPSVSRSRRRCCCARIRSSSSRARPTRPALACNYGLLNSRQPSQPEVLMRRIGLAVVLAVSFVLAPLVGEAQEAGKVWRIGLLDALQSFDRLEALRAALRDLGYIEGKNIIVEYRSAEGKYDRLPDLAAGLVVSNVDIIVTVGGTPPALAAKQATATIPIVMTGVGDAVASGLVSSLARPGGNVTGVTDVEPELVAKRLELLKETLPRAGRVAVLREPNIPMLGATSKAMEDAAKSLKLELQVFTARGPTEFEGAFSAMAKSRIDAVLVTQSALFNVNVRAIADLAAKKRLPSVGNAMFGQAGGSIGYGVNFENNYRRAAFFVDRIFKGAKPADLPVEQATKFELVINLKTAKELNLKIPQSVLLRADQVIE